ncbi:MAG: hypothetical protein KatS3mg061_1650 [Dehalococcoidia bacterium]|nr:MAG: hypothetical protein KatS3mg061_1650 [Dehalococcoidia bacterium]
MPLSPPSPWPSETVPWRLPRAGHFGRTALVLPRVVSTMDEVWQRAATAEEGLVVLAEEQTGGRGRFRRPWRAPAGSSLLLSLLFRPPVASLPQLPPLLALAAAEAIEAVCGRSVGLKWPNDLLIAGRKVGGILVESQLLDQRVTAVGGIGINGNFDPATVPGIPAEATSLLVACGRAVDRPALLEALLARLDAGYARLLAGENLLPAWRARLVTIGRWVTVQVGEQQVSGQALDVDREGKLILRRADGSLETLAAGEVTLQR